MRRNAQGYRIGQCHGRATQPDAIVREARLLHEQGASCREILELFAQRGLLVRYRWLRKIVSYQIRTHPC